MASTPSSEPTSLAELYALMGGAAKKKSTRKGGSRGVHRTKGRSPKKHVGVLRTHTAATSRVGHLRTQHVGKLHYHDNKFKV